MEKKTQQQPEYKLEIPLKPHICWTYSWSQDRLKLFAI